MKKVITYGFLISMLISLSALQGTRSAYAETRGPISGEHAHPMKQPVLMPTPDGIVMIGYKKGDSEKGAAVFKSKCVYCHGHKGLGNGVITLGLDAAPPAYFRKEGILYMTDQDVFNIIRYGTKTSDKIDMPAWAGILTEEQTLDVLAYIRKLASKTRDEMTVKGLYEEYAKIPPGGRGRLQLLDQHPRP